MKIIFFGSDDFAVVNLSALLKAGHDVAVCVTAPDKPKGRGLHVTASPVKEFALAHKIAVLEPTDLCDPDLIQQFKAYSADLFVVIAYGKILPAEVLLIPKLGAINSHGSLLPKYRGAAPINWAMVNGEVETGISIIKLNAAMDAGDIIAQVKTAIDPQETAVTLRVRLANVSAECLIQTVLNLEKGKVTPIIQKKEEVTFAPKLKKEMGLIDWSKSSQAIHDLVRGLLPWPTAYSFLNKKMIKVLASEVVVLESLAQPGEIVSVGEKGFVVATGHSGLRVTKVHPESGKPMAAKDFIHGHKVRVGDRF